MNHESYFANKSAIVTGAASGIGLALCEALLEAGASVTMADRNEALLVESAAGLAAYGERVTTAAVDVTRQEEVAALVQNAAASCGRLDLLFNNAGVTWLGPADDLTLDIWRRVIDIDLWGVIYGVDAALPIMLRQGSGHIVNTASVWGLVPSVNGAPYAAAKHAVVGLSESLRLELAPGGIAVSVVCPGAVATPIFGDVDIPPDALTPRQAAKVILGGVARQEGIIVVGDDAANLLQYYRAEPEACGQILRDMTQAQMDSAKSK
ncbi:MAG: SDR family oxidoreductase [Clostridiales bacterium]|nr:SDR family oxidoreductase [Clostridiales bacterium]